MYKKRYEIIKTKGQLNSLVKKLKGVKEFAFDTETNTLKVNGQNKDFKLVGISISWGAYHNYYIPVGHVFDTGQLNLKLVVDKIKPLFEREDIRLIGWNLN